MKTTIFGIRWDTSRSTRWSREYQQPSLPLDGFKVTFITRRFHCLNFVSRETAWPRCVGTNLHFNNKQRQSQRWTESVENLVPRYLNKTNDFRFYTEGLYLLAYSIGVSGKLWVGLVKHYVLKLSLNLPQRGLFKNQGLHGFGRTPQGEVVEEKPLDLGASPRCHGSVSTVEQGQLAVCFRKLYFVWFIYGSNM